MGIDDLKGKTGKREILSVSNQIPGFSPSASFDKAYSLAQRLLVALEVNANKLGRNRGPNEDSITLGNAAQIVRHALKVAWPDKAPFSTDTREDFPVSQAEAEDGLNKAFNEASEIGKKFGIEIKAE